MMTKKLFYFFMVASLSSLYCMQRLDLIPIQTANRMEYIYLKHLISTAQFRELDKICNKGAAKLLDTELIKLAYNLSRYKQSSSDPAVETFLVASIWGDKCVEIDANQKQEFLQCLSLR